MTKVRTDPRELQRQYYNILSVPSYRLRHLLKYEEPFAYIGSNDTVDADVYDFSKTAIVMGLRPYGNVHPPYGLLEHYDKRAERIIRETEESGRKEELLQLLDCLLRNTLKGGEYL